MKTKYAISILILTFYFKISLIGQTPEIKNQRGFKYNLSHYLESIEFNKIDIKSIDFDFRIWYDDYSTGQTKLIGIIKLKNGDWFVRSLDYWCYNDSHCDMSTFVIDTLSLSNTWDSTWKTIIDEDLLNLPRQEDLNKRIVSAKGELLFVADGSGYCFEIWTKRAKRSFRYSNVNSYVDFYMEHGIASADYTKALYLIDLIEKEFDWTFKVNGLN